LKVDRIIGHSFGQLTALCVAGSLSLSEAVRLVSERARLVETHCGPGNGLMLAVEGADVEHLLRLAEQECQHFSADISCYNGPRNFVIAGDEASIQAIEKALETFPTGFRMKRLDNSHAFHSQLLDGIIPGLLQTARELHFEAPAIPIEACSNDDDWSEITAEKIARHTRMSVRFMDAVRRVEQQVDGPVKWLEAGSGSPIIPMIKRAVNSQPPGHQHVYIPTSLQGSDAQINLAKTTCRLWSNNVRAQFWPFHGSQRSSYRWVNLPPYQFAKIRHWLEYKPTTSIWESTITAPASSHSELVRLLPDQTRQGEALFEINPKHELYQLSTSGHEVVEQSLCPASLYIEFVLIASRLLSDAETAFVPHIGGLTMSSPLVLSPAGRVFLRLVEEKSQAESWVFSIFSHDKQTKHDDPITHGSGRVTVSKTSTPAIISNFQTLSGLMLQRCKEIEGSSMSVGFKGPTVYQAMRRVVTYLDYYHGIQSYYTLGNEAVAHITMPPSRPSNMGTGFCDPVLMDSFTQAGGVLANCFCIDEDGEMWICNFIGDITFSQRFVENGRKKHSWTVYSKYERPAPKKLHCDIFVFDPESGHLVLTIMAISFQKASIRSLTRILGKLNSLKTPVQAVKSPVQVVPAYARSDRVETDFPAYGTTHDQNDPRWVQPTHPRTAIAPQRLQKELPEQTTDTTVNRSGSLQQTRKMLSDVLEIPPEEISPESILEDLGIDSLLATELFTEISKRFKVSVSHSDFATITDVQGLAQLIPGPNPSSTPTSTSTSTSTSASTRQSTISSTPVDMETIAYGERDGIPLSADIYYPNGIGDTQGPLPIGGSIHPPCDAIGDGH
jgi:acyl carrier protein